MLVWKLSLPSQAAVHRHRIFFQAFVSELPERQLHLRLPRKSLR